MSRLTTLASTGRRMKRSVKAFIGLSVTVWAFPPGGGSAAVSSMVTGELACSLIWPAVTTRSPALTPSSIATRSPRAGADAHEAALDDEAARAAAVACAALLARMRRRR